MTATSAQSANETPSPAHPLALRTVLLAGSERTYANRDYLRGLGLRWDPEHHRWHGTTTAEQVCILRERLGLEVRCFGSLDPPPGPEPARPTEPPRPAKSVRARAPITPVHDFSRTHVEARVVYRERDEDADEFVPPTRTFRVLDITSDLPDDSKEAEERGAERQLRDLRGRVKRAREVITGTPGLFDLLAASPEKTVLFCARYGITERMLVHRVEAEGTSTGVASHQ